MSATATAAVCEEQVQVRRERRPCARPAGITLGQLLTRAHEAGQAGAAPVCPVCTAAMEPDGCEASCSRCGSRIF